MPPLGCTPGMDLLVAAPSEPSGLANWGDYHFGRSFVNALRGHGVDTRLLFRDNYKDHSGRNSSRTLLVLRGKYRPDHDWLLCGRYRHHILWLISWPLDVLPSELELYDLILVASHQDRPRIAALSDKPTLTMPQATAFRSFGPAPAGDGKLLFIGNTRGLRRPIVQAFAAADTPLALIGQGWEKCGLQPEATSIANNLVPQRYGQALAVLNDHHGDMRTYGYMNNRIYDVLACAVPVITDHAASCPQELLPGVIVHRPGQDDPAEAVSEARRRRRQPEALLEIARNVRRNHSFSARANQLLTFLNQLQHHSSLNDGPRSQQLVAANGI